MSAQDLNSLFNNKIFRIPDYQRGYAWGKKQLNDLWDDLAEIDTVDNELRKHYTGTIYLERTEPHKTEKWLPGAQFYNVVDGQQRLTTISILLFELLKATEIGYAERKKDTLLETFISQLNIKGKSKVYKFSYAHGSQNYNFLLHSIFEDKAIVLNQETATNYYTKNLAFAKEFFREKIKHLDDEQKDLLFRKVTIALRFDIREIKEDLDVQAVFETMNNRGKPLSILEKLKNRLIYLTEKLSNIQQEDRTLLRDKINDAWGKIYISLGKNPDHNLDEDEFLSAHFSLYTKPKESVFSEKIAEEKVFQMFCNKPEEHGESPITFEKIRTYIISLSELAPIWYRIHNSKQRLVRQVFTLNERKELKIFIAAILNKIQDQEQIDSVLSKLEKILFRNRVRGIEIMDERKVVPKWAREIYNDEKSIKDVNKEQDEYINIPVNASNIVQSFRQFFTYVGGRKGFHRWNTLKYFLFEYEEFLRQNYQEDDSKVNFDYYDETTLEHIIPNGFKTNWSDTIEAFSKKRKSEKISHAKKVLINSLGNLTILKGGKNSGLGNKGWEEKKERYRTGSYNEIEISKNEVWTEAEIAKRGEKMLRFLETKVDGLKFSKEDIKRTLFYDDYIIKLVYKN